MAGALYGAGVEKGDPTGPDGAEDSSDALDALAEISPYFSAADIAGGGERNTLAEAAEMGAAYC